MRGRRWHGVLVAGLVGCAAAERETALLPLPAELVPPRACAAPPTAATERGLELARRAELAWERAPFDAAELPRAVLAAGEAANCFTLGGELSERAHSLERAEHFTRELTRRAARAELGVAVAQRASDARALARHVRTLLALTSEAGPPGAALRDRLTRLLRVATRALAARDARHGAEP